MYLNKSSNSKKNFLSKISTHAINDKFFNQLQQCSPFGSENSNPLFLIEKIKVIKPIIQKDRYISLGVPSLINDGTDYVVHLYVSVAIRSNSNKTLKSVTASITQ